MKNICSFILISIFSSMTVFGAVDDNSIIEELDNTSTERLDIDFKMKSFESCDAFEDVMETYMKSYWKNNYNNNQYRNFWFGGMEVMEMAVDDAMVESDAISAKSSVADEAWAGVGDFSETNTQIAWVDESDIIKTDGKYIYYYNETEKAVFIIQTGTNGPEEVVKKINMPENFYWPQLYLTNNRLVIIASGYSQTDYSKRGYYINRNSKTYTIVFNIENVEKPELLKLYSSDGDYGKSRRIGDYVYVLSRNYFNYPYWNIKSEDDIVIDAEKFLPKRLDVSKTDTLADQNLTLADRDLPYNVKTWNIADCSSISYNFPDEDTLKNTSFNPGYNIISIIDIKNTENRVETEVIAGSNSEIFMSTDNLYLTEGLWQQNNFSCPANAICAMPFFWGGTQNTLVHKMNIDGVRVEYQDSALVPGAPLNQYSMDEYQWDFRIITSQWSPERSTGLYILDENLEKVSDLTNLAPGETFQSSRFIGDKLFLVTFEQIDPLFAIDLSDNTNPTVLWELKIPWFSTYLHPYDETHLIGLGYDTEINTWGGTQTAGVKVDLYKINYDKKCWDAGLTAVQEEKCESWDYKGIIVEQKYTKTLGWKGSYSEALNNPRMFIWNPANKTLLLPATLQERDDNWRTTDYYNGLLSLKVDKNTGITLNGQNTHINMDGVEEKRIEECEKYSSSGEPVCRELLNGELYCEDEEPNNGYVPNYCFKDSTVWTYIGEKQWEYRDMQMKRALYIWDSVYGISDAKIWAYDWNMWEKSILTY